MDLGLTGKVALVTGGSEGIGKAAALSLVAEGAKATICARREDVLNGAADEIRAATGGEVLAVSADVSTAEGVQKVIDATLSQFGRLDILVNNAGTSAAGPFESVTDEGWQTDLDLKLFGAIRFCRLAIPHMREQGGGRIINVTNLGGRTPGPSSMPTSISRAAGIAITKGLSKDLGKDNILVNTVCIGVIKSGQHERRYARMLETNPNLTIDEFYDNTAKARGVPLGRVAETEEAGDVIAFLASERASYLTGVAINIDGGSSAVV